MKKLENAQDPKSQKGLKSLTVNHLWSPLGFRNQQKDIIFAKIEFGTLVGGKIKSRSIV